MWAVVESGGLTAYAPELCACLVGGGLCTAGAVCCFCVMLPAGEGSCADVCEQHQARWSWLPDSHPQGCGHSAAIHCHMAKQPAVSWAGHCSPAPYGAAHPLARQLLPARAAPLLQHAQQRALRCSGGACCTSSHVPCASCDTQEDHGSSNRCCSSTPTAETMILVRSGKQRGGGGRCLPVQVLCPCWFMVCH